MVQQNFWVKQFSADIFYISIGKIPDVCCIFPKFVFDYKVNELFVRFESNNWCFLSFNHTKVSLLAS